MSCYVCATIEGCIPLRPWVRREQLEAVLGPEGGDWRVEQLGYGLCVEYCYFEEGNYSLEGEFDARLDQLVARGYHAAPWEEWCEYEHENVGESTSVVLRGRPAAPA